MGKKFEVEKKLEWSHPMRRIWVFIKPEEREKEGPFLTRLGWSRDFKSNAKDNPDLISVGMMKRLAITLGVPKNQRLWFYEGDGPPPAITLLEPPGGRAKREVAHGATGSTKRRISK
ncbi:MAG: hypothetical protein WC891_08795 [Actinomycetota bacterium]|jgi:hypothetical protein